MSGQLPTLKNQQTIMAINVTKVKDAKKNFAEAINFLSALDSIAVDTETTGVDELTDKVLLISAGNQYKQFVFDVAALGTELNPLKDILNNPKPLKILHNAKFDYKFLKVDLGIVLDNIFDTMIAEMLLLKGRKVQGFALDDVCSKYLSQILNKDIRKTFIDHPFGSELSNEQMEYSGIDVAFLHEVRVKQIECLKKHKLERVCALEMAVLPATADIEINGMFLDRTLWKDAEQAAIAARDAAKLTLDSYFAAEVGIDMFGNANINYNSPKQLLPALKKLVGKPAAGLTSTAEAELKEIDHPVTDALLLYREKEKRVTTYGASFLQNIHPKTGRIHSTFSQLYTDTGRYSSSDPNLQNIPREKVYRKAFTAKNSDYRIVGADYSGMELRILADLSLEPKWIDCFVRNGDLHGEIGSELIGKPVRKPGTNGPNDPGENADLRENVIKRLNFGIGYGMGPKKLARETGVDFNQAKILVKQFWLKFPNIKTYFDKHVQVSIANRCVRSPYDNRLRWLDGYDYDSPKDLARIRNMCMNFPMQSGNASITKIALTWLRRDLAGKDALLISTVHDEILVECHKDIADEVLKILEKDMIDAAQLYIKNVKVTVSSKISTCWEK